MGNIVLEIDNQELKRKANEYVGASKERKKEILDSIPVEKLVLPNDCYHLFLPSFGSCKCVICGYDTKGITDSNKLGELIKGILQERGDIINVTSNDTPLFRILLAQGNYTLSKKENNGKVIDDILEQINQVKEFEKTQYCYLSPEQRDELLIQIESEISELSNDGGLTIKDDKFDEYNEALTKRYEVLILSGENPSSILGKRDLSRGIPNSTNYVARAVYSLMTTDPEEVKEKFGLQETPKKYLGSSSNSINKHILLLQKNTSINQKN